MPIEIAFGGEEGPRSAAQERYCVSDFGGFFFASLFVSVLLLE